MKDSQSSTSSEEAVHGGPLSTDKPARADGRRQMLVYLPPQLIKALKARALDEDKHAYELVERAVEKFLADAK